MLHSLNVSFAWHTWVDAGPGSRTTGLKTTDLDQWFSILVLGTHRLFVCRPYLTHLIQIISSLGESLMNSAECVRIRIESHWFRLCGVWEKSQISKFWSISRTASSTVIFCFSLHFFWYHACLCWARRITCMQPSTSAALLWRILFSFPFPLNIQYWQAFIIAYNVIINFFLPLPKSTVMVPQ